MTRGYHRGMGKEQRKTNRDLVEEGRKLVVAVAIHEAEKQRQREAHLVGLRRVPGEDLGTDDGSGTVE